VIYQRNGLVVDVFWLELLKVVNGMFVNLVRSVDEQRCLALHQGKMFLGQLKWT
jgi:hypothetical protein